MVSYGYILFALLAAATFDSPTSAAECPPTGVVVLPHADCTKFTVCVNGQPNEQGCPRETFYNPRVRVCDFPVNVPECVGGTRPPPTKPTTTTELTTTESGETPEILSSCGDTLTANSGIIRYKLDEAYSANEICAFVVRTLDHSGFVFNLRSHGINDKDDSNAINIFTYGANGQIDSAHMGPPNPLTSTYVSGAIAVVVFRTARNNGTGFELSFQGVGKTAYADGVQMVFSDLDGGNMTIPSWERFSGTTNLLVFTANHKKAIAFNYVKLTFSDEDLYNLGSSIECGFDSLRTYSFYSEVTKLEGLFCNEKYDKSIYTTNGILIVVFRKFYDGNWGKVTLTWKMKP